MPSGPGVRVDTGLADGDRIPSEYDNLIAKIMVHGPDRDTALDRLDRALGEVEVAGVQTTLPFHQWVARDVDFRAGDLSTEWVGEHWDGPAQRSLVAERAATLAALAVLETGSGPSSTAAGTDPPNSRIGRGDAGGSRMSGWGTAAREAAVDRWPR